MHQWLKGWVHCQVENCLLFLRAGLCLFTAPLSCCLVQENWRFICLLVLNGNVLQLQSSFNFIISYIGDQGKLYSNLGRGSEWWSGKNWRTGHKNLLLEQKKELTLSPIKLTVWKRKRTCSVRRVCFYQCGQIHRGCQDSRGKNQDIILSPLVLLHFYHDYHY